MNDLTLYIATKNISSWSLRAWLILKHIGLDFNSVLIELDQADTKENIAKISPSHNAVTCYARMASVSLLFLFNKL